MRTFHGHQQSGKWISSVIGNVVNKNKIARYEEQQAKYQTMIEGQNQLNNSKQSIINQNALSYNQQGVMSSVQSINNLLGGTTNINSILNTQLK